MGGGGGGDEVGGMRWEGDGVGGGWGAIGGSGGGGFFFWGGGGGRLRLCEGGHIRLGPSVRVTYFMCMNACVKQHYLCSLDNRMEQVMIHILLLVHDYMHYN